MTGIGRGWRARVAAAGTRPDAAAWGSPEVERASRFVRARAGAGPAEGRPWFFDWRGALAFVQVVRAEPALEVTLTDTPAGRRIHEDLLPRTLGVPRNRVCVAVWDVPADVPERPSGKKNQALRTALTAGARAGMVVREVTGGVERHAFARAAVLASPRLAEWALTAPRHDEQRWWVVTDADGNLHGLAAVVVDEQWASLVTLVGLGPVRTASDARFVLHHAVTRALAEAGTRHLGVLDDSPLLTDAGARHLQRVLGYRLARLRRPTFAPRPEPVAAAAPVAVPPRHEATRPRAVPEQTPAAKAVPTPSAVGGVLRLAAERAGLR